MGNLERRLVPAISVVAVAVDYGAITKAEQAVVGDYVKMVGDAFSYNSDFTNLRYGSSLNVLNQDSKRLSDDMKALGDDVKRLGDASTKFIYDLLGAGSGSPQTDQGSPLNPSPNPSPSPSPNSLPSWAIGTWRSNPVTPDSTDGDVNRNTPQTVTLTGNGDGSGSLQVYPFSGSGFSVTFPSGTVQAGTVDGVGQLGGGSGGGGPATSFSLHGGNNQITGVVDARVPDISAFSDYDFADFYNLTLTKVAN
jgi:hypothetical protein